MRKRCALVLPSPCRLTLAHRPARGRGFLLAGAGGRLTGLATEGKAEGLEWLGACQVRTGAGAEGNSAVAGGARDCEQVSATGVREE